VDRARWVEYLRPFILSAGDINLMCGGCEKGLVDDLETGHKCPTSCSGARRGRVRRRGV